MNLYTLDLDKFDLEYLRTKLIRDYTDDDIKKMTEAYSIELLTPKVPQMLFTTKSVSMLLNFAKCKKCGRCCLPDKTLQGNPGVIVNEADLLRISKDTKHSLKSLKKMTMINRNPDYQVGAKYLPLPCIFFNKNERICKIYSDRPFVCRIYPVLDAPNNGVSIDVHCEYGKEIFQKAMKYTRALAMQKPTSYNT